MARQHVTSRDLYGPWVIVRDADGQPLRHVTEANAGEGWFIRLALDADGRPRVEDGQFVRERVEAPITLELAYAAPGFARRAWKADRKESDHGT